VKCQFGYRKVRYRGIAKNGAQVFSLLALANLYLARGHLCQHDQRSARMALPTRSRQRF
jgi:IS5 family transposase